VVQETKQNQKKEKAQKTKEFLMFLSIKGKIRSALDPEWSGIIT
jgi:hypothetical protein